MAYNNSLADAGALLGLDGLHPLAMGARVSFSRGRATVTEGTPIEAKEVVGGCRMTQVKSKADAIAWAFRAPMLDGDIIEIRQVQEMSDFPEDVRKAAAGLAELKSPPPDTRRPEVQVTSGIPGMQ